MQKWHWNGHMHTVAAIEIKRFMEQNKMIRDHQ